MAGLFAYALVGKLGLYLLLICWRDYATHSTHESYTLPMLIARLLVSLLTATTASISATKLANDSGKSAWVVGALVFTVASYIHLLTAVWREYPVWYHWAYLLPIIPVTGLSQTLLGKR